MRIESRPEVQQSIERLVEVFAELPDGAEVEWAAIELASGIAMDTRGKGLARRALSKIRRPYESLVGKGVRLSTASSAMTIIRGRFTRVDSAVRLADRTQRQLQDRHLDQMTPREQQRMLAAAALFGAIRVYAAEGRTKLLK